MKTCVLKLRTLQISTKKNSRDEAIIKSYESCIALHSVNFSCRKTSTTERSNRWAEKTESKLSKLSAIKENCFMSANMLQRFFTVDGWITLQFAD